MGIVIDGRASLHVRACSDLDMPRKVMEKALTKQVTARPAVRARPAPQRAKTIFTPGKRALRS